MKSCKREMKSCKWQNCSAMASGDDGLCTGHALSNRQNTIDLLRTELKQTKKRISDLCEILSVIFTEHQTIVRENTAPKRVWICYNDLCEIFKVVDSQEKADRFIDLDGDPAFYYVKEVE